MLRPEVWIAGGIVLLALVLRLANLSLKPPHFDEGVNGWFVDQMTKQGFYHYDPSNFHGPLHFYLLFVAQTLLGRHIWVLRLPGALISAGCVALVFAFRRYLSARTCQLAALAMAVSPGMVYFGRHAIHESTLVFSMMIAVWGGAGLLWRKEDSERAGESAAAPAASGLRHLWAVGLGVTGMILTKETYAIHLIAFLLAWPVLIALESFSPSAPSRFAPPDWPLLRRHAPNVGLTCAGLILFFYSGGLFDPSSLPGLVQAFARWGATATNGASGHDKPWPYWLDLLNQYECSAAVCGGAFSLLAVLWLLWPRHHRLIRYLGIVAVGTLTGYSIIKYKTPWCIVSILWPFFFVFGYFLDRTIAVVDRWVMGSLAVLLLGCSLTSALLLNFKNFVDENEPYVYVQTSWDIHRMLDPLRWLTARDAVHFHGPGHILIPIEESHPIPWLLGDFTNIDYLDPEHPPAQMDAEFLLVDDSIVSDTEEHLTEAYFKESFLLRENSPLFVTLYLRASTFAPYFPGRLPEFPSPREQAPAEPTEPNEPQAPKQPRKPKAARETTEAQPQPQPEAAP